MDDTIDVAVRTTINLRGLATWNFDEEVLIQDPDKGNWAYSDPKYGGDGMVEKIETSRSKWLDPENKGLFGREAGIRSGEFVIRPGTVGAE